MNRRAFLAAVPAVAIGTTAALPESQMSPEELCNYHAEKLRDAMQGLHGGTFGMHLCHVTKQAWIVHRA